MASAGHPPPGLVRPDGTADFIDIDPGPPLGVGGLPFEVTEIDLTPGSVLALYTDGLVEHHHMGDEMEALRQRLASVRAADGDLQAAASRLVSVVSPGTLTDDITLLLARVRAVADHDVASWDIPADPSAVADARDLTTAQLAAWGLEDLAFTTELMVSELVTNAIRYASTPIVLRLIRDGRDDVLVCEVSDPSDTQPRLRYAGSTDEGGRGLFLVAQLATRWGSRYNSTGKTIWTEQPVANRRKAQ
jgi:anti-sigma regulatory factor (Ser/Thr protein kinase)